ncbi:MAG: DUF4652 domain-containing protein [Clostridiales bacterium]|nr:DUF4652 domain-containing protein [Clostridiales bacterium]
MKKLVSIILIAIIVLAGCQKTIDYIETDLDIVSRRVLDDNSEVLYRSDDFGSENLITIIVDGKEKIIEGKMPSPPVINTSMDKFAFIDELEWEVLGNVWVYDTSDKSLKMIVDYKNYKELTSKVLLWYDEDVLLIIMGYPYGTVTVGGSLYGYSMEQEKLFLLKEPLKNQEIKSLEKEDNEIVLEIAEFDENYMNYTINKEKFKLEDWSQYQEMN